MKTTLFTWLAAFAGMDTRKVMVGQDEVISITGPYKLLGYMLKLALFAGLISYEQIARFGIRQDGKNTHLVLTTSRTTTIDKKDKDQLTAIDGYDYCHSVTTMWNGVNVSLFDAGFDPNNETVGKAYGQFVAAIFDGGKVRGSDSNTLLLLGTDNQDRVLCASQWGKQKPLTELDQEIQGDVRYGFVQDNTIVAIENGTGRIAALHVNSIVEMFETAQVPTWAKKLLAGIEIEEITASIGDQPTVALTFRKDGETQRQLGLGHIAWTGKDKTEFKLVLDQNYVTDVPQDKAPAVRLSPTTLVAIDGNGSDAPRVSVKDLDDQKDAKLRQIAQAAASGKAYQQAFSQAA